MLVVDKNHKDFPFLLKKIQTLLKYQFDLTFDQAAMIFSEDVIIKISRKTKRIRQIEINGKILFTLRPNDGFLVFHIEGASQFLKITNYPKNRIIVFKEIADLMAEGRTLFTKHVKALDKNIKSGSEVIITDDDDNLLAIGKSLLNFREIRDLNHGMGVKIRRGIKN